MKKNFFIFCFLILGTIVYGQDPSSQKYIGLIKKADTFYRVKNYKSSALTYSQAFKLNHWKVSIEDRYNAACVFALAEMPDSSFFYLNNIAITADYANYHQITTDHDLQSLRKDKRWKQLIEIVKQNKEKEEAKLNKPLIQELDSIRIEDQKYRLKINDIEVNYGFDSEEMQELFKTINEKDSINLIKVKYILNTYGWLGPDVVGDEGNTTLFLVIQHSDQKTQEKYLPIMRETVKNGKAQASDLALLEDRVALRQGKKQIYGSQIIKDPKTGKDTLAPIENFVNVDKRRAAVGLGLLEEYVKKWGIVYKTKAIKKERQSEFSNSDFATATEIRDSIIGPMNVSSGYGSQLDFKVSEGYKEENSAWFKFTIDFDTVITFDIVPENPKDDYDFILFKCPKADCINKIQTNVKRPDRWCFSINYDKNGSTGLSEYASSAYLGAGPGYGYVSGLPVKAGETCYLMINFPENYHRTPKGFTIYFYNYWPKKPKELKTKRSATNTLPSRTPIVLENVLFELNKTVLLKESSLALDKLVDQLQTDKTMKIEIKGHTDNTGNEIENQKLSERRAKAIVDYLVAKNIDKNRLSFKGFGSKQPIASNDTEEGRKKNRRVEFFVIAR